MSSSASLWLPELPHRESVTALTTLEAAISRRVLDVNEIWRRPKRTILIAARMEDVHAMESYGVLLGENDLQRWHWLGLAAVRGRPLGFCIIFKVLSIDLSLILLLLILCF